MWKALLLREATFRLFGKRAAWVWLLVEPITHFAFFIFLYTVIRQRTIGGIDTSVWLIIGLFGYFTFRRTASQVGGAIDSNRALLTYRQVLPFDAMIVRAILEGLIMLFALVIVAFVLALEGHDIVADRPLVTLAALFALWLLGIALGLNTALLAELAEESRVVLNLMMMPLYFISGVVFPVTALPVQYRGVFLVNPIFNALDVARSGFSGYYHATPGISLGYVYLWALCSIGVGLLLYRRIRVAVQTT